MASITAVWPKPGQQVRVHGDLPVAVQALDLGRGGARRERGDVVERHAAEARRGHRQAANVRDGPAVPGQRAQVHFVLLAALVEGGDLVAADQQPHGLGRVADLHAEVGGLRAIERDLEFRLPGVQRDVDVDRSRDRAGLGRDPLGVLLQPARCRGRSRRTGSRRSAARPRPWRRSPAPRSAGRPTRTAPSAPSGPGPTRRTRRDGVRSSGTRRT